MAKCFDYGDALSGYTPSAEEEPLTLLLFVTIYGNVWFF
jgi:hypothetical protein